MRPGWSVGRARRLGLGEKVGRLVCSTATGFENLGAKTEFHARHRLRSVERLDPSAQAAPFLALSPRKGGASLAHDAIAAPGAFATSPAAGSSLVPEEGNER